jgi:hypothetical protein
MELEYEKKEITASPKTKAVKPVWVIKDGYELYLKRGLWHVKWDGGHEIFTTEKEAKEFSGK